MQIKNKQPLVKNRLVMLLTMIMFSSIVLSACGDTPTPTLTTTAAITTTLSATPTVNAQPTASTNTSFEPILFVHGNGDYSALWISTLWRFESNGYPRDRLFTLDYPYPSARDIDNLAQPSRSSTQEQRLQLSTRVDEILAKTGASKLILVGQSRGGNSIRNYLKNGGGAAKVSKAIVAGTPNHGVPGSLPTNNEFNGQGSFLKDLNTGDEVVSGVSFLTIRSDKQDKYAQPDSNPAVSGYAGPELKGAKNVVIPNLDHRETGFSVQAFSELYQFIMGRAPTTLDIVPETSPILTGIISGYENKAPTNKGVEGVSVSIFELEQSTGKRQGGAVYQATTNATGSWGSFTAKPTAYYEFVVQAPNQPIRHFFRSSFLRSTSVLHMRLFLDEAVTGKALVFYTRPRGYVSNTRDKHSLDSKPVPGVKDGVPTDSSFRVELEGAERSLVAVLNGETIVGRSILNQIVYIEFTY